LCDWGDVSDIQRLTYGTGSIVRQEAAPEQHQERLANIRESAMTGPPAPRPEYETAPPDKRADHHGIPVRLHDGTLIALVNSDLADEIVEAGAADAHRRGSRRYLRLRQGIRVPRKERGWDIIEFLRKWHGDKRAADYVAHKDRQSERLGYLPDTPGPDGRVGRRVK